MEGGGARALGTSHGGWSTWETEVWSKMMMESILSLCDLGSSYNVNSKKIVLAARIFVLLAVDACC